MCSLFMQAWQVATSYVASDTECYTGLLTGNCLHEVIDTRVSSIHTWWAWHAGGLAWNGQHITMSKLSRITKYMAMWACR